MLALVLFVSLVYCGAKIKAQKYKDPVFLRGNKTQTFAPISMERNLRNDDFASLRIGQGNETTCLFKINKHNISALLYSAENKMINIVEINPHFANNRSDLRIGKQRWILANRVGREIILIHRMTSLMGIGSNGWFLTVNTKTAKVDVFDYPPGCIAFTSDPEGYFVTLIVHQISTLNLKREICYNSTYKRLPYHVCCTIPRNSKSHCYIHVRSKFACLLQSVISVIQLFIICGGYLVITYFCICLPWQYANENNEFYKLAESQMSVSHILFKLFWEGHRPLRSFARRSTLIGTIFFLLSGTSFFYYRPSVVLFWLWALLLHFSKLFERLSSEKDFDYFWLGQLIAHLLHSYLAYDVRDIYLSSRKNFLGAISLITLPLNLKRWRSVINVYNNRIVPVRVWNVNHRSFCIRQGKFLILLITGAIYVSIVFVMQIILIISGIYVDTLHTLFFLFIHTITACQNEGYASSVIRTVYELLFISLSLYIVSSLFIYLPARTVSIFCGLILNIVYFIPYISFLSVLTFYSLNFWKNVEERYITLKSLIHKECKSNINDGICHAVGTIDNNEDEVVQDNEISTGGNEITRDDNSYRKIECVVSRELYDEIRELLLLYHWNLSVFAFRVVCVAVFAYFVLALVEILQASDISPTVQMLTTFSVGALPYVMNTFACKNGDEEKSAWKENLQADVKYLVNRRIADNPKLARTSIVAPL